MPGDGRTAAKAAVAATWTCWTAREAGGRFRGHFRRRPRVAEALAAAAVAIREAISSRPGRSPVTAKTHASPSVGGAAAASGSACSAAAGVVLLRSIGVRRARRRRRRRVYKRTGDSGANPFNWSTSGGGGNALSRDYMAIARPPARPLAPV